METRQEALTRLGVTDPDAVVTQTRKHGKKTAILSAYDEHRRLAIDEFTKRDQFEHMGFVVTDWPTYFTIDWNEDLEPRQVSYQIGNPAVELDDLLESTIDPLV